jgi:hypothetical protein
VSKEWAQHLYQTGRAHALSSQQLYEASMQYAQDHDLADPDHFAFNGTFSLSVFYLLGLGLELFLKAAIILNDESTDPKFLSNVIRHNLLLALDTAEEKGFESHAPRLRAITEQMSEPYAQHHFRYERPELLSLFDIAEAFEMFVILDGEFEAVFQLQV